MSRGLVRLLDSNILLRLSRRSDPHYDEIRTALIGYEFLPDSQAVHDRWRSLLVKYEIKGVRVHDARLAPSICIHDVLEILTINVRDFGRFEGLTIVCPADVK